MCFTSREKFNEKLEILSSNLLTFKRDISTARSQLQTLSREQYDSISSVAAKVKLTLTENQSILLDRISQLSTQYNQLWKVKQNMGNENKRLMDSIKECESQLSQKEEEDKIVMSQLRKEINGKNNFVLVFCVYLYHTQILHKIFTLMLCYV